MDDDVDPGYVIPAARTEALVTEEIEGETLVYDLDRDRAHALNPTAAAVWRHCHGGGDITELTAMVAADLDLMVTEDAVWRALSQLAERHLLAGELPRRISGPEFSRRQALVRIGAAGATAGLALPVVKSIVAPTAAQAAASCVQLNGVCGSRTGPTSPCTVTSPCCPVPNARVSCAPASEGGGPCTCQVSA